MRSVEATAALGYADALLSGRVIPESGNAARLAAFVARQAVEWLVDARCAELGAACPNAKMASKLAVLKSLDETDFGPTIAYAWNRLSECCHQHAYELSPTVVEVSALCVSVAECA
ncbi:MULTISPECIES: hypothetical protein [Gordonia]|uniref:hypothetical protein n=1 Tax=Gordonia TaxID=2053 RepID=UPI003015B82E